MWQRCQLLPTQMSSVWTYCYYTLESCLWANVPSHKSRPGWTELEAVSPSCFEVVFVSDTPWKLPTYTVSFFPLFSCLIHVQRDTFVFGDELNGDVFFLWVVPILVIWRDCRPFWLHTTLLFSKQYKLRVLKNMGEYRGCNLKKASSQLCWNSDLTLRDHITLEAEQGRLWLHGSVCIHHTKTVLTLM